MVGIVVVSHSRRLAESAVDLALQMAPATPPPIEIAAGLDDEVLGTDAARVKEAIDHVASSAGVLVVIDLGSAVLSAELALELREEGRDCPVVLSDAPLVEGLVAAVALAAAGASLSEVAAEASRAAGIKSERLAVQPAAAPGEPRTSSGWRPSVELVINNAHGLHARPAARFVATARRFDADVTVRNLSSPGNAASGRSVSALSTLGIAAGDRVEVSASGDQAGDALDAIVALAGRNFDEPVAPTPPAGTGRASEGPVAASPGIGIGRKTSAFVSVASVPAVVPVAGSASEQDRLVAAIEVVRSELRATRALWP